MRQLSMRAAIHYSNRDTRNVDLKDMTAEEKHVNLLVLLLKIKDGFAKEHVHQCSILGSGSSTDPVYIVHATLLCKSAIQTWTTEALIKFLIGDLGVLHYFFRTVCI